MKNKVKRILLFLIMIIGTFVVNTNILASSKEISNVRIVEQSGSVRVIEPTVEGEEIKANIEFNEVNDFVTYEIEIKNEENKKYKVESILDNNSNENITTTYEIETKEIKEKGTLKFRVKIEYKEELINVKTLALEDIGIKIKLIREDGKEKEIVINNPKTGDGIVKYFLLLTLLLIGIIYQKRNKRLSIIMLILSVIILPFVALAIESKEIEIKISNMSIKGYMVPYEITYNYNNGEERKTKIIRYGEELGNLETPEKEGYDFIGWFDGENEVSEETIVTKEMNLEAKYSIILYSIDYNLNEGILEEENPNIYTVEDEITLNNPSKIGYTFIGWTGSNGEVPELNVKIEKGSIESKEYTANFTANLDTAYKVIHKQMNLEGNGYTVKEEENLEGETDSEVTPEVKTYTGFISPEEKTVVIKADGSLEVEYLYERKKYNLELEDTEYIKDSSTEAGKYYYQTEITLKAKTRTGYTFVGWSDGEESKDYTFKLTSNKTLKPVYTANTDIPYKVIHKKMNLDGTYVVEEEENLEGTTDSEITPGVKTYTGFISPEEKTVVVKADGSLEVEYLYERRKYTLTLESQRYISNDSTTPGKYYYETEVNLHAVDRFGYTFLGWSNGETEKDITFKITRNIEIGPVYVARNDTPYKVIHKKMNIDGNGYTTYEEELKTGTTDSEVTPEVKTYTGFTSPSTSVLTIKGDGTSELIYLYERNKYTLNAQRTYLEEGSSENGEYYYNTEVTLKALDRAGYTFTGWSDGELSQEYTFKIKNNLEIKPEYEARNDTPYKVIHKKMNIDGNGYTTYEEELKTGTTDTEVTPGVKTYAGFTSPEVQSVNIDGDGSRVVEYLYTRNKYTLTAERTYLEEGSSENGDYYYNTEVTLKALDRAGYTFTGWSDGELSQEYTFKLKNNLEIKPEYEARNDTPYKVVHKKMNIDGNGYTTYEEELKTGTTDTSVTPEVKTYTGFTSPEVQTVNIDGDGSRVVEYLYERNKYTLTINNIEWIDLENSNAPGEYYYETEISVTALPKVGYNFEWNDGVTTYENAFTIRNSKILTPIYTPRDDIAYKVIHKLMNSDGETYYVKDVNDLEGVADSIVVPTVNIYEGFTSPEAREVKIEADGSTVVEYLYTRNKYTFNIEEIENVDIENSTAVGEYYYGTTVHALAKEKVGYTFVRWSNNETNKLTEFNLIKNTAIKPIYAPNIDTVYTVVHKKMNMDGETYRVEETEVLTGTTDEVVTPEVKTYEGFTSPEVQSVNIDGDGSRVVEYLYERNKYRLTLKDQDYISINSSSEGEYYYESEITLYSVDRFGYKFIGWSDGGEGEEYTFTLLEDKEIGPVYLANTDTPYKVIHKKMNLDGTYTLSDIDLLTGTTDTVVIPERKIYNHYISPEGKELKIKGNGKSSLEYLYEREKYNLSYENKEYVDLEESTEEGKYYYETEIKVKAKDKTLYTFTGWSNGILSQEYSFNIEEDITLEPLYEPNTYTVTFNANSGSGEMSEETFTYDKEETVPTNTFTKTGYHFVEWNTKPDGSGTSVSENGKVTNLTTTRSVTLYAEWAPNTNTPYKVIHKQMNLDGSTYTVKEEENLTGTTDTSVTPAVKNYTGFESPTTNALTIKGDGTSELIYLYTRNTYTVSYDSHGGSTVSSQTKYYGSTIETLPTTTRTGYTFDGWFTEESGGTQISTSTTVTDNITYHAHWTINKIYIKLDMNSGSLSSSHGSNIGTSNTLVTVDNSTNIHTMNYGESLGTDGLANYNNSGYINIVRTGYVAKANEEWNTSSNGTGTSFDQNTNYQDSSFCDASVSSCTVTLYVNWQPQKVTVSFYKNGGTGTDGQSQTFTYGVANQSFANKNFSRSGYEMLGWNESSTATTAAYSTTSGVADSWINSKCGTNETCSVNLYAIWKQNSVTCSSGQYLPANSLTCQSCTAGYRCSGGTYNQSSSIQGRTQCTAGTFSTGGASSCTACANGSYSSSNGATSCTACAAGKTNSGTGNTSCSSNCSNSAGVASWKTPSWSNNSTSNLCTANSCNTGYYINGNNCSAYTATIRFGITGTTWTTSTCPSSAGLTIGSSDPYGCYKTIPYGQKIGTMPTPPIPSSYSSFSGWYFAGTRYTSESIQTFSTTSNTSREFYPAFQ